MLRVLYYKANLLKAAAFGRFFLLFGEPGFGIDTPG
ncbi:hypothetical protein CLOBOL_06618 [Enterocloster bolteae ATCC BAA-613]|uniref:Uncharacterized protein n=1 Tax=Enterocloster bolteae (strain ATCC BAA-613 / DSM 15670 / CCUG 46953 / JCM 12243 / WAL 16351) TaxID=411902 RepID=A8S3H5_ENTBW|nr:hypothetical protein CLOBOL_06618 [Enterocloster bolteae ATCC BAA-613]